jgi:hypothetical protein
VNATCVHLFVLPLRLPKQSHEYQLAALVIVKQSVASEREWHAAVLQKILHESTIMINVTPSGVSRT